MKLRAGFPAGAGSDRTTPRDADSDLEALLAFPSERAADLTPAAPVRPAWHLILVGAVTATLCLTAVEVARRQLSGPVTAATTGGLTIVTRPPGADVMIDGERRGAAPLTLSLNPGAHTVAVRANGIERSVPVTIVAGSSVEQHFEIGSAAAETGQGTLAIATTPAGARVTVDGQARGVSPVSVSGLPPGDHRIVVEHEGARATRVVSVQPGATASVVFSLSGEAAGPVGGWLTVASPFEVQIVEGTEVVGASATSRIMLAAGRHNVRLVNADLAYSEARTVTITPGGVTTVSIDPPKVPLNVNARPWADVFIDNAEAGQTPIANLPVALGTHQIVFRHPQLGEHRQTIVVTATGPNRVSADLTR